GSRRRARQSSPEDGCAAAPQPIHTQGRVAARHVRWHRGSRGGLVYDFRFPGILTLSRIH
ncbi:MAG: hypothetical protein WBA83_08830, partial [Burkholderiaceae bacterium]